MPAAASQMDNDEEEGKRKVSDLICAPDATNFSLDYAN